MTIRDTGFLALETAFNKYLSLDPEISQLFSGLHGSVIGFDLSGTGLKLFFIPRQNGQMQILSQLEGETDCLITGSPLSLLRSHFTDSTEQLFSGSVVIEGDAKLAQEFTAILKRVDIDWEEQLSAITGDLIAHQLGNAMRQTQHWLKRNKQSARLNVQEYLQEEARLLPGRHELENFYADVDRLRDDSERLAARIERLRKAMGRPS